MRASRSAWPRRAPPWTRSSPVGPQQYEAAYKKLGRRHELLTQALLSSSRVPLVRRQIVPMAARLPRVFAGVVDQLARPA